MKDIILVPTDFSEVCANAANQAAEAAALLGKKVTLLHIINSDTKAFLKSENFDPLSVNTKLDEIATDLRSRHGVDVDTLTREGSIFTEIAEVAKDLKVNMIFLGTHGKVGLQHLTGSYALKVITSSPAPTIVVQKRAFNHGYKNIVLPITSEAGPLEKTQWAVHVAKQFNSTIHIYLPSEANDAVIAASKQIEAYFEKNGVAFTERVSEKSSGFAKQVLDYSTATNADLIMIMTNPDKGFSSFFLGSYDEDIIFNAAQIPVMCINPRRFNYEILGL